MDHIADFWAKEAAKSSEVASSTPINHAAWQKEKHAPFVIEEAPFPVPDHGQIVVKVGAVAMNPADWAMRDMGILIPAWPTVFGFDAAGVVIAVGKSLNGVHEGDRVFGFSMAVQRGSTHAAFQEYMIMDWPLFGKTPSNVSDAEAATLSVATATAAHALFGSHSLGLDLPQATPVKSKGETVIVWSGATSVGACGIQMLVAAGYDVLATSSPRNFDFCKSIGASDVYDYNSESVTDDIIKTLQGRKVAGALGAISSEQSIAALCRAVATIPGAKKHVLSVFPGSETWAVEGVKVTVANSLAVAYDELGVYLWGKFLPQALQNGTMRAKPEPKVVGKGLESINLALDTLKAGVSATKLVVTL